MKVEGKLLATGSYKLERVMYKVIGDQALLTYMLTIDGENITLLQHEQDVTAEIRRLEFKKKDIIFIWRNPSRVGLPFKATPQ